MSDLVVEAEIVGASQQRVIDNANNERVGNKVRANSRVQHGVVPAREGEKTSGE